MKINPIQFNLVQSKPQNATNRPILLNNGLQTDIVSFSGKKNKPVKRVEDLVPKHQGIVYKKVRDKKTGEIKKIPQKVDIINDGTGRFTFETKDKYIGYVHLYQVPAKDCFDTGSGYSKSKYLQKNYKNLGVVGDRIIVGYLENNAPKKYCGIGHLADLLEVAICKELGFEPNVVSISVAEAAPMHYKRGKRFIPYEQYYGKDVIEEYNLTDKNPNNTIREIIKSTSKGNKFNTSELKTEPLMYMPKEMVMELEKELEEHPIF